MKVAHQRVWFTPVRRRVVKSGVAGLAIVSEESDQRHVLLSGEIDGEGRRGSQSDHAGKTGDDGFLDEFVANPACHEQTRARERAIFKQRPPDRFVYGVVTADILTGDQKSALSVKQRSAVDSACLVEQGLRGGDGCGCG